MCYMSVTAQRATVGVRELRQNLSVHLRRVARGETLTVTERRRVVAVLAPAGRGEDAIGRLVAAGRATAARLSPRALPPALRLKIRTPLSELVRTLGEDTI